MQLDNDQQLSLRLQNYYHYYITFPTIKAWKWIEMKRVSFLSLNSFIAPMTHLTVVNYFTLHLSSKFKLELLFCDLETIVLEINASQFFLFFVCEKRIVTFIPIRKFSCRKQNVLYLRLIGDEKDVFAYSCNLDIFWPI